ncbi:MAG: ABC transporter permease [Planctomycetota bacterium]|nr:ABC transporter permease [Planctomycetota bacterium]
MRVLLQRYSREASVAAAYAALLALLAWQAPRYYQQQFASVWVSIAPVLVLATGMALVILARHIDISIGWQLSVCGVVAGLMARQGVPMPAVVVLTIGLGAVMGAFNGALVAFMGLPSIVVTLATMVILRQGLAWVRQGEAVYGLPADFQWFGQTQAAGQFTLVVVALGLFGAFAWGLRWLAAGRAVYAVGSDHEAARLAGIRPHRVVFGVFVLMGALAGLAAMLQSVRSPQVDPNAGKDLELQVIAAVVVGGVAISGGRGTLIGVLLGVALLGTIGSALVFLDVHSTWQRALEGLIILIAVSSDALRRRAAP